MISIKRLPLLALAGFVAVSCSPMPPEAAPVITVGPDKQKIADQNQSVKDAEARAKARADKKRQALDEKKRRNKEAADERKRRIKDMDTVHNPGPRPPEPKLEVAKKPKHPTAKRIPGRQGFVFNPYTYDAVDVRGIPSGSLVVDPNDPDKSKHKFFVP